MARTIALYNQITKQHVEAPVKDADKLLRDPAYLVLNNQELTVVDPWGQKFSATGQEVYKHLTEPGFRLETEEEEHQRYLDENYGGVGGAAAAGVLGAARGATLGITDLTANAAGFGETIADLAEAHPGVSTTGEVIGAIAPILLSGGSSAPVQAAGRGAAATGVVGRTVGNVLAHSPAALTVKGGNATAHAVEQALRAGTTLDKGAVLMGKAAGMAAEGAMFAGGAAVSEALLGDPEATASDLLVDWSTGAAEGAAFGGVLGVAFGLPGLRNTASRLLSETEEAATRDPEGLRKILSEVTGRDLDKEAVGVWRAVTDKVNKATTKMKHGRANPAEVKSFERLLSDPIERAAATLDDATVKASKNIQGKLVRSESALKKALNSETSNKAGRVAKIAQRVPDMSDTAAIQRFQRPVNTLKNVLDNLANEAREIGHSSVVGSLSKFQRRLVALESDFSERLIAKGTPRGGEAAMVSLDNAGELLNKELRAWHKITQFKDNAPQYLEPIKRARIELRSALKDSKVFGAAGDDVAELFAAADGALSHQRAVLRRLTTKVSDDSFGAHRDVDVAKLNTLFKQLEKYGDDAQDVKNLEKYLKGARQQLDTNKRLGTVADDQAQVYAEAEAALDDLIDGFQSWKQALKIKADFRALSKLSGFGGMRGHAGLFKAAGGLGVLGGMDAGAGVGMFLLGQAANVMMKPAQYIRHIDQLHHSRTRVSEAIRTNVRSMFSGGKTAAVAAGRIGTAQAIGRRDRRSQEDITKVVDGVSELAAAGPAAVEPLSKLLGPMQNVAPNTAAAIAKRQQQAATFVYQKASQLGVIPQPNSFRAASPKAQAKFWRTFDMVNDPGRHIIEPMARGVFEADAAEVLREVYPSLLEGIKSATWEEMADATFVDASTARRVSRILDVPHPGALSADTVRVLQNAQSVLNPSDMAGIPGSGRPSNSEPLTAAQRLESK